MIINRRDSQATPSTLGLAVLAKMNVESIQIFYEQPTSAHYEGFSFTKDQVTVNIFSETMLDILNNFNENYTYIKDM